MAFNPNTGLMYFPASMNGSTVFAVNREFVPKPGLPPVVRVGVATGYAVTRAGDWFGSPVNVASRITAVAQPGGILMAESTKDAIGNEGGLDWTPMGARALRGVSGEVKLFEVQRA